MPLLFRIAFLTIALSVSARGAVIATVGTQEITDEELNARTAEKLGVQRRAYEAQQRYQRLAFERGRQEYKEAQLEALIDERVLASEAKARSTTAAALMAALQPPAITDEQVKNYYAAQKTQINLPYDEAAPKIRQYLQKNILQTARRRYLDGLRAAYGVYNSLEPYREDVAAAGPARGPQTAPVTLVEFSDFECPFCGRFEPVLRQILAKYAGKVRLVYRNFPLSDVHPEAQKAAEAAVCAQRQGKFWEMHDLLFAEQNALRANALKDKARRLGMNQAQFDDCLDSGKAAAAVAADVEAGEQLGLNGTPASFVNGRFKNGALSEQELTTVIDDELRRADKPARHGG